MMSPWRTLVSQLTPQLRRQGSSSSGGQNRNAVLGRRSFAADASFPKQARVVICGGGIVGNSVAYHLAEKGWTDVVLIEQDNDIGKGTSVFGSGVLALLKPVDEQRIINKSIDIYKKLQQDGHNINLQECGSLYLAQNRERMVLFRRRVALNKPQGVECKILGPMEIQEYHPLINTSDLQGGIFVEADAVADPIAVCKTFANLASTKGVKYFKNCQFRNLVTEGGRVAAVDTSLGTIQCEFFVNCAGMWAWELGQRCTPKVRIPVHPAEHYYLLTEELSTPMPSILPTIRDYDSGIYCRKLEDNSFLLGGFEAIAKPVFTRGVPKNYRESLQPDWDHFAPMLDRTLRRMPSLKECGLKELRNDPDNFTPDGKWILGETPEIDNYFVAAGMNGNSLQGAGGIGSSLAHWITEGEPDMCLIDFDVRRFVDVHNNRRFLYERVKEIVGKQYTILFPLQTEYKSSRNIRCSPLFSTLKSQGAVFGAIMSFERALYFDIEHQGDQEATLQPGTYWKPPFFDSLRQEYRACREGVAVIDLSSFSKFQISSARTEVVDFLQRLCSNDIDVPVGHVSPSGMHNERGGYENDCMLIRQTENSYFMVSPSKQQTRVAEWMERHLPEMNGFVTMNDVTSMYTVLLIIGPKSRELLSQLTEDDVDLKMMPFTFQMVSLGCSPRTIMLLSVTNSGEPGYSLYIPSEYAVHVYDELMKAGKDYGIKNAGYLTLRFLRLERFIPFWGEEMDSRTTPLEIGRVHRVKFDKDYFIGKNALQKQHEEGIFRRLVHFTMDDDHDTENDVWVWGGEPIFRNGTYVGSTTSGGYGFTLERMVALGFIVNKDRTGELLPVTTEYVMDKDALYQIDIAGRRFTVRQSLHPPRLPGSQVAQPRDYVPTLRDKSILQAKQ